MKKDFEYSVNLIWSEEDDAYIARIPELAGCMADGETLEEALSNIRVVAQEWIEVAKEDGRKVPPPESLEEATKKQQERNLQLQGHLKAVIEQAVKELVPKAVNAVLEEVKESKGSEGVCYYDSLSLVASRMENPEMAKS